MQVSKVARGLIEILRLRPLGQNPPQLEDALRATIDATEMYGSDMVVVSSDVGGAGVMTRTVIGTAIRPGRLLQASGLVGVGAAAGTQIRLRVGIRPSSNFTLCYLQQTIVTAPVAGATYVLAGPLTKPIVYGPGWQFVIECEGDAGGADHTLTGRYLFEDFNLT